MDDQDIERMIAINDGELTARRANGCTMKMSGREPAGKGDSVLCSAGQNG